MGEREITARSDVYALGAMTYEMLVGEPPFTGPHRAGDRRQGADRGAGAAACPPAVHPAGRRGRGAHRAREAAGRSVRIGPGVRRRAGRRERDPPTPGARARPAAGPADARGGAGSCRHSGAAGARGRRLSPRRPPVASRRAFRSASAQAIKVTWDPGLEVLPAISPDGKTRRLRQRHPGPDAGLRPAGGRRPRHRAHRRHHPGPVASALVARREPSAVPRARRCRERRRHRRRRDARGAAGPERSGDLGGLVARRQAHRVRRRRLASSCAKPAATRAGSPGCSRRTAAPGVPTGELRRVLLRQRDLADARRSCSATSRPARS